MRKINLGLRILSILRAFAPWIAVGCVILALVPRVGAIQGSLARLGVGCLAFSFALCVFYRVLNAGVWAWILQALGYRLPSLLAMRAWLTSESLRWLPGSIWGFCSRVDAARTLGVPAVIASLSLPVELVITVVSWTVVASVCVLLSGEGGRLFSAYGNWLLAIAAAALVAVIALGLGWPLLVRKHWFSKKLESLKAVLRLRLDVGLLIRSSLFYTALNGLNGIGFWLILAGMGYQHAVSPSLAVGVNAVGWLIGFFAIGVPGGIGVREAGSALLLTPNLSWQEALLAAVLWRAVQMGAELAGLLPWLFTGYRRTRSAGSVLPKEALSIEGSQ